MSPTLLVVAAWIAGSPWGPRFREPVREVAPPPPALLPATPRLLPEALFAGEPLAVEVATRGERPLVLSCPALGWDEVAALRGAGAASARWQLVIPDGALPGVYVLELRDALGDGREILALVDLVVLADG